MYPPRLASPEVFRQRLIGSGIVGFGLIALSLGAGIAGYMITEDLPFIDAFVNAAMILSGMGPLRNPGNTAGKVFAGIYAIYCGFAVLGIAAIMFAPLVHRIFHRLHVADTDPQNTQDTNRGGATERRAGAKKKR